METITQQPSSDRSADATQNEHSTKRPLTLGADAERDQEDKRQPSYDPYQDSDRPLYEFSEDAIAWFKRHGFKPRDVVQVVGSAALLAVTFSQLVLACNNARDTAPLVGYAQKQTAAAQRFADNAGFIKDRLDDAVQKLNLQAAKLSDNAGQTQRLANETQAANGNVLESDRPWLGVSIDISNFVGGAFLKGK